MRVVTDSTVKICWSVGVGPDAGLVLSVAVKAGFLLKQESPLVPLPEPPECSGDVNLEDDDECASLVYPSDFALYKPRADVLLVGVVRAPGGESVSRLKATLRAGQIEKAVYIVGDRSWRRRFLRTSRPSPPTEFTAMPVTYQRAYGGRKFKKNPVGLGFHQRRLPNIESPKHVIRHRWDRPPPAGFGPIAADWEPRRSKVGTYRGNWRKERWPWFPDNFNWSYFNAAPEDQQVEGYLRGDEELELQNLHPTHAIFRSRLPGLRARAFVQVELPDAQPEFRDVKLNLDTLWIDTEAEKAVLVWRGLTPVRSVKFKEVTHVVALTEPMAAPLRTKDQMHDWMIQQIAKERGEGPPTPEEAAEEAAEIAAKLDFAKAMAAMDEHEAALEKECEAIDRDVEKKLEEQKAQLIAEGLGPLSTKEQTIPEMQADLRRQATSLAEIDPEAAKKLAGVADDLSEFNHIEQEFAALGIQEAPPPSRESVRAALGLGKSPPPADGTPIKSLAGADLSGLDLSNTDFSRADLSGTDFSGAKLNGANLAGTQLTGADFSKADLTDADFSGAILDDTTFSKAKVGGTTFTGASIQGASFEELQMPGANFSGCKGRLPDFAGSNLEKANFAGARLPRAVFTKANVKGANFQQAELPSADFGGASATGINMEQADLTNLRAAENADFTGGRFREAKAPRSIWEGALLDRADFAGALLTRALFEGASVKEASFNRADLTKANLEDVSAQRALLTNANLLRASFNRANLTEASLAGSNLYEAGFWETVFHQTNIRDANLKRTLIA